MGTLLYGLPPAEIEIEDRLLAHLKPVIVAKLRRAEPFLLSWSIATEDGSGRRSIWMHPSIPLQFAFVGSRRPLLNKAWLDQMMQAASSNEGLIIMDEPSDTRIAEQESHAMV